MSEYGKCEQIVAEALNWVPDECSCHRSSVKELADAAVEALRAAGRLAGEPTEAQVEAAWQSLLETATDVTTRVDIRAALVAAAGVAPGCADRDEALAHAARIAGENGELLDRLADPVQPSSTVDEGKIAEVLGDHNYDISRVDYCNCGEKVRAGMIEHQAHAVVEAIGGEIR